MKRRELLLTSTVGLAASCGREDSKTASALRLMVADQRLVILSRALVATDIQGSLWQRLDLPDCCKAPAYVSSDAMSVSWVRASDLEAASSLAVCRIKTIQGRERITEFRCRDKFWLFARADDGSRFVAIVRDDPGAPNRLVGFDLADGAPTDLGLIPATLEGEDIETLRISARGDVVSVGSREMFVVIGLNPPREQFAAAGRFPMLAADGSKVAYVSDGRLLIASLADGRVTHRMNGSTIYGVGGWSPDGGFLLAGGRTKFALHLRLVALHVKEDRFAEIGELPEGEYGCGYFWLKRDLLN